MQADGATPRWRVRRIGGLLAPGFSKQFARDGTVGTTFLLGVPIGRFRITQLDDGIVELRYVRWPIVDTLDSAARRGGSTPGAGYVRLPGGRRWRFCRFSLER
ncbi:MAG: hypothetical protein KDC46_02150 [Thermoleophilia bacterium]|nr:hypothetical protein [Thermoleophilia bacterium]